MDFKTYYDSLSRLEQQKIRSTLQNTFCVNESTVYRWIKGEVYPGITKADRIVEIIGIEREKLFPNQKRKGGTGR